MKTETLKAIVNAFNSASDDATRPHIQHVCLTPRAGELKVRATDGHVLASFTLEDELFKGMRERGNYYVSPDSLPLLKTLLKQFKNAGSVPSEVTDSAIIVKGEGYSIEFKHQSACGVDYPETDRLSPNYTAEPTQIGLNPELLMSLFKSLRDHDRATGVTLVIKDRLAPIRVVCGEREGLLMPMRMPVKTYFEGSEEKESA